jgi:hypothetical protein
MRYIYRSCSSFLTYDVRSPLLAIISNFAAVASNDSRSVDAQSAAPLLVEALLDDATTRGDVTLSFAAISVVVIGSGKRSVCVPSKFDANGDISSARASSSFSLSSSSDSSLSLVQSIVNAAGFDVAAVFWIFESISARR